MNITYRHFLSAFVILFGHFYPTTARTEEAGPFTLGVIQVKPVTSETGEVGTGALNSTVTREEMLKQNRNDVGDAVNLLPGVILSTNPRNEKTISVRGYDARQVPLFIDGVPVYVPYDGYVDFARFGTGDLSFIQVEKGYSSVGYGPNTLGGAINLISRKPVRELEGDLSLGAGSGDEHRLNANLGTKQKHWYLQSGVGFAKAESFPVANGGARDNSYREDVKYSVKAGVTPRASDEYALSYYQQNGEKGQPPSTDLSKARYWRWPYWDKRSVYFVSQTALSDKELLKVRLYHDRFDNEVNSFTDGSYAVLKTSGSGSIATGKNIYRDRTNGASLSLETFRWARHSVSVVGQIKDDQHRELDAQASEVTRYSDRLLSLGAEDSMQLSERFTWLTGASQAVLVPGSVYSLGNDYSLPGKQSATDLQTAFIYKSEPAAEWHLSLARKTRMPTLKDRYSQRLGQYVQNPDLRAERALNIEVGHSRVIAHALKIEAALFLNELTDKIQTVANVQGALAQMQNVDRARVYGAELGVRGDVSGSLTFLTGYTYLMARNLRAGDVRITDLPRHKLSASLVYKPLASLELTPSLEHNSDRWVSNERSLGAWTIYSLKAGYRLNANSVLEIGGTNLADAQYSLADGFPNPGRMFFANLNLSL